MGGGLMQLVAYGAQDIYLTGNPQITFFKVVYRRHTNFSMESIEQTWSGNALCGRATATISRNGDLVHKLYLQQTATVQSNCEALKNVLEPGCCGGVGIQRGGVVVYNPTHTGIDTVEVEIGGQCIDRQSGKWMEVWSQLTEPNDAGVLGMVGPNSGTKFQNMARGGGVVCTSLGGWVDKVGSGQAQAVVDALGVAGGDPYSEQSPYGSTNVDKKVIRTKFDAYVPLQFWFCRNPGLALPLIALQYHEVRVILSMKQQATSAQALCDGNNIVYDCNRLYADYIYLDTDERRRFAQVSHEYLIEQVQHQNFRNTGGSLDLNFNHPVKELIWTGGQNDRTGLFGILPGGSTDYEAHDYYRANGRPGAGVTYQLKLNGHDRMSSRPLEYFTKQQVYDYHTGTPVGSGDSYVLNTSCGLSYALGSACGTRTPPACPGVLLSDGPSVSGGSGCDGASGTTGPDAWLGKNGAVWAVAQQTGPGQASNDAIAVYSFALKPEEHQPSGTCNFSRIDNAQLVINGSPNVQVGDPNCCCCDQYDVCAVNYNVLRIMSGMGGLSYSN
jgi:hypothetical protein